MERTVVNSSNLVSVGYDEDSSTLEIEFKGGAVYRYFNVPSFEHERLMAANSHGVYFNTNIKDKYPFDRA
ncbi:KTSC domain-containing protein [Bradyrhizobium sp. CCGUVB23]|uniref:KTSC domain-containing protein n=1 Tax=Bradyrhizobium sp. CCGUVB23 TaxID=2949630 RepID=UPI0020B34EF4|nr:KTSC domain-containing protein [Bradyrhizobium sp. CCGUVB23]MCP3463490.1 KTSC domain-containing protein [Bradyrhizobium sp. CCGUVB23]